LSERLQNIKIPVKQTTSIERVLKAVNHQQPDRIPFDLGSTVVTGITKNAYINLTKRLGHPTGEIRLYDTAQQLAVIEEKILQELQVDVRGLIPNFGRKNPSVEDRGEYLWFSDEWSIEWKMPKNGFYFDPFKSPLSGQIDKKDIDNFPWPDPTAQELFEGLAQKAKQYHQQGYAVILENLCSGIFEMSCRIRGTEQFLMDLALNPDLACELLDKFTELKIRFYEAAAVRFGQYVQFIRESDDIAGQEALLMSPKMYRELIKPRHKQLFEAQKKLFSQPFFAWLHSDGALFDMIPDFIEIGLEVLNPVQLTAKGMDAAKLKAEYGKDIAFWGGGVNTQSVLPRGTPDEVKKDVRQRINLLAPDGGFIFGTVHNIQDDVPPQNIIAMLDEFKRLRDY
jgi:uroporphyrinogen decarboxylase